MSVSEAPLVEKNKLTKKLPWGWLPGFPALRNSKATPELAGPPGLFLGYRRFLGFPGFPVFPVFPIFLAYDRLSGVLPGLPRFRRLSRPGIRTVKGGRDPGIDFRIFFVPSGAANCNAIVSNLQCMV